MSILELKNSDYNRFNLNNIIDFIYSEYFNNILIEEKSKFIKNIKLKLKDIIKRQNINSKTDYEKQISLLEKEEINIINRYEKDYSFLKKELIKYEKYPKEVKFLKHFRKHCIDINQTPLHKCNDEKFGKFIEVFEDKKNKYISKKSEEKSLYVICSECNKCYYTDLIKIFCSCCKTEYFSSKLGENENENILPATWKEYHCKPIIVNETMKCFKCENVLYINLYTKKLVCLNTKCNFISDSKSIIWKCKLCRKDFTSAAKIFNPLENKILQKAVFYCLLNKEICLPQKIYCCCLIKRNTKFAHNKKCDGELYKGILDNKLIVVCEKCHAVNYYEKFIWICPSCNVKFYYNGKKYIKEKNNNIKLCRTTYSSEKYKIINTNKNNINKAQKNLSSNIRIFIPKFDDRDKNKVTLYNNELNKYNNSVYNNNTFDIHKKKILENDNENNKENGFFSKYRQIKKKKNLRYKTLYDILKEKKNKRNKSINFNDMNYNATKEKNDKLYLFDIKEKNFDDNNNKPQTTTKKNKSRNNSLIQNYIYKNDIVVNININSDNMKNSDNVINISNISNPGNILSEKNILEKIEESEKENNIYEYESIRKNLHKNFQDDSNNYLIKNNSNNNLNTKKAQFRKLFRNDKNRDKSSEKYKIIYKSCLTLKEKEINKDKNNGKEYSFYNKRLTENEYLKEENNNQNYTINSKNEDINNDKEEKKSYKKFRRRQIKSDVNKQDNDDINNKNTNVNRIYNSSRFRKNKFFRKLFLDKPEKEVDKMIKNENNINNNIKLNEIPEYEDLIQISPLGDIGSSLLSKDDFLKISMECKIPTFDENNILYIRPIGQGSYGVIYLVEDKNKKTQYALKSILCNDLEQILKHKKEFELSYSLQHNNFIKIYNALFKYLDMTTYMLYILMERGESDWNTEIEKRSKLNNFYNENELIYILKQLVDVLSFFQKNNIAHRDIKPQNILIFKNNIYKITDLGEAKDVKNNIQLATLKGSHFFMSPNLFKAFKLNGNNSKVKHNIYKSDVFSLGYCFLYAMNLKMNIIQSLREENDMVCVANIVKKFGLNEKYSEKFMNIIYKMIHIDENKRLDFIELFDEINKNFKF